MSNININFENPWLLLLFIPVILLTIWPYFRLPKQNRRTRNRIVSMVLHIVVSALAIFVLAGMSFQASQVAIKKDVIIVVDTSKSNEQFTDQMNQFIQAVLDELPSDYNVGIVTFANGNVFAAQISNQADQVFQSYLQNNQLPDESGTDIAGALRFAHSALSSPSSGRIILLSDGRETDGSALAAARTIANSGTRIDVRYTYIDDPNSNDNEVQINSVNVPDLVSLGANVTIAVTVQSKKTGLAYIKLFDNDVSIGDVTGHPVMLSGGTDVFVFDYVFDVPNLHEIRVQIDLDVNDPNHDVVAQNNTYYAFVNIDGGATNILIIDGTGNESTLLEQFLSSEYELDVINVTDIPLNNLNFIRAYDQVILMNVANSDLPEGFDNALLTYVRDIGGGLFTVGGDKAYNQSDMSDTLYESILPISANTDAKSMAIILVIDASGSMTEGGSQKLNMAKQGAIDSVNAMRDSDFVGIITFNTTATVLVPPTPVANKEAIISAIQTIGPGNGTYYIPGLQSAKNQLDNFPGNANFNKHVIFLTDGFSNDGEQAIINMVNQLPLTGISLSTIALYDGANQHSVNFAFVASMVRHIDGRGSYYEVSSAVALPGIMQFEVESVAGVFLNEEDFEPVIHTRTPAVSPLIDMPILGGYYGVSPKPGAIIVLAKEADPIYAEWQFGEGRVGSFMSDFNGHWSSEFFNDVRGHIFISNTVKALLPEVTLSSFDIHTHFTDLNYTSTVRITSNLAETDTVLATVTNPNGITSNIVLAKQSNSTVGGSFKTDIPGIYKLEIKKLNGQGTVISETVSYTTFSYSDEYDGFFDIESNFTMMRRISEIGNGDVLYTSDGMFSVEAQTFTQTFDPTIPFLIIALVLFLLDIVARKFKFKWPHEFFRKNNQQTAP